MAGPEALETSTVKSPEEQVCREGSESLYEDLFSGSQDYSEALQSVSSDTGASQCLQEFDSIYGAPVIDFSSDICESPEVSSTEGLKEPITKLPVDFSGIPEARAQELDKGAQTLLDRYYGDEKLSFRDISDIQKDIARREDLTEVEKCRLWTGVHHQMREKDLSIDDSDENPAMVDSWKGSWDPWHAVIGLNDGYHANELINMSPEDASKAIFQHEDAKEGDDAGLTWQAARFALGINQGDINASEGQLAALRKLRDNGSFAAYAEEWEKQFVK
jgi:hypothetical protein